MRNMAARSSSDKTTLLLFTKDQEENAEKLRTVLESEGEVFVLDLADIAIRGLSLKDEIRTGCNCTVLICSSEATRLINEEESYVFVTKGGQEVNFDGKVISNVLKEDNGKLRRKIIPVSFVELPSVLHGAGTRRKDRQSAISFEINQGEITEVMLEGDILQSLIDAIKTVYK